MNLLKDIKLKENIKLEDIIKTPTYATVKPPKISASIAKTAEPKKGFEGFYERHNGKITVILALIAIIEGIVIFLLSK